MACVIRHDPSGARDRQSVEGFLHEYVLSAILVSSAAYPNNPPLVDGYRVGTGYGSTAAEAQRNAALQALRALGFGTCGR